MLLLKLLYRSINRNEFDFMQQLRQHYGQSSGVLQN